ncbi:phosphatase PAP2 family protein [Streptomyces synnematoformans]|uniref:Phosphatase PAP2 family protein n=2 Tax=Streptomyces synnematoformans TaxID=415721 RepID=A0ABN2YPE8_9ACTN
MGASYSRDLAPRPAEIARTLQDRRTPVSPAETDADGRRRTSAPARQSLRALLDRMRSPRPPRLWFEIMLVALVYWTYSIIRNAVPEQESQALKNADRIWSFQESLGLAFERSLNHAVEGVTWLVVSMNYYYGTLHYVVTLGVLVWLYRRQPGRYAAVRLALAVTTCFALVGYYSFPLAPPRLMEGMDFVDTVRVHETLGSMSSGNLANVSNQYAAMPSMHVGWSVWAGITIAVLAKPLWVKVLGGLYPVLTLIVIMATANHFWMDAVGGVVCLAFGFAVSYAWYGTSAYRLPQKLASP